MNCSVVSVFTNLHCADCVCLYSKHLGGFLQREMLSTRYGPVSSGETSTLDQGGQIAVVGARVKTNIPFLTSYDQIQDHQRCAKKL